MGVKLDVSALTRLAERQTKAAARVEAETPGVVAKNGELLARVVRANTPVSGGRHDERGESGGHLQDEIAAIHFAGRGLAGAVVTATSAHGQMIAGFIEHGTGAHMIGPRPDGPGYLWWPERYRVSPTHKVFKASVEYGASDDDGRITEPVRHPGTKANPIFMDGLLAVTPKLAADIERLGTKGL